MPDVVIIITVGTGLLLILGMFIAFMALVYQQRRLESRKQMQDLSDSFQRESLKARIEIQEQTFLSISQEIHDNVGQVLSLIRLNVSTLACGGGPASEQKIASSKELLDQAIEDLRDLSKQLNSNYMIRQSLASMLQLQLLHIQKTGALETSFEGVGEEKPLNAEKKLFILRIAQEAIQNTVRHAHATRIDIKLTFQKDRMHLSMMDDGIGFPSPAIGSPNPPPKGTGTQNMRYRAELIGAELAIQTTPDAGTRIILNVPY